MEGLSEGRKPSLMKALSDAAAQAAQLSSLMLGDAGSANSAGGTGSESALAHQTAFFPGFADADASILQQPVPLQQTVLPEMSNLQAYVQAQTQPMGMRGVGSADFALGRTPSNMATSATGMEGSQHGPGSMDLPGGRFVQFNANPNVETLKTVHAALAGSRSRMAESGTEGSTGPGSQVDTNPASHNSAYNVAHFPGLDPRDATSREGPASADAAVASVHQQLHQAQLQQQQRLRQEMAKQQVLIRQMQEQQLQPQQQHPQQILLGSLPPQHHQAVSLHHQLEQLSLQGVSTGASAGGLQFGNAPWQNTLAQPAQPPMQYIQIQNTQPQYGMQTLMVNSAGHVTTAVGSEPSLPAYQVDLSQMPVMYSANSEPMLVMGMAGSSTHTHPSQITYISSSNPSSGNVVQAGLPTVMTTQGGGLGSGNRLVMLAQPGGGGAAVTPAWQVTGGLPPLANTQPGSAMPGLPGRFQALSPALQHRIMTLCCNNPIITVHDFDQKVISKLSLLVDAWGIHEAFTVLEQVEHRLRTKQGIMKNGPGYLDVAICSHMELLKAQAQGKSSKVNIDEYAQQVLAPPVFHELRQAVSGNAWLEWSHFDEGMIQLIKRFPVPGAVDKLRELTYHSFKNVENVKGCVTSILNSKFREDRRKAVDMLQGKAVDMLQGKAVDILQDSTYGRPL